MPSLGAALRWIGDHESKTLVLLTLVALCSWGFAEIADHALDGDSQHLDQRILLAMRTDTDPTDPIGPIWVEELARDVTALGSMGFVTFLTLASAGFLALQGKRHPALYLIVAVSTGTAISLALKSIFDRPRPDLVPHAQAVYTSSFPSGHTMLSTLAFFTVAAILASAQTNRRLKAYLLCLAAFLSLAVGLTRIYLGVHWPTDVLAGWTAGAAWALLCWTIADYLRRRRLVR
jgi:undecaprenyl-diphosphatase